MIIIPAIDLLNGKVVRLNQGLEKSVTVYSDNPLAVAIRFQEAGARWIHMVNLDGAFGRPGLNDEVIERIISNITVPVELGGGIRSMDRITYWLEKGISRVVLGSVAVHSPELVEQAVFRFGQEAVVAGIDIRNGMAAVSGWTEKTEIHYLTLAQKMKNMRIRRAIVTDIVTDGMLSGPNTGIMTDIALNTGLAVIASGGIGCMQDIRKIADASQSGIEGVIVGKAFYEKKLDIKQAIEQFQTG